MPVVTVQSQRPPDITRIDRLLVAIPEALASALSCATGEVWVDWIAADAAVSNNVRREFSGHNPLVTIRARAWRPDEHVRAGLVATAEATAYALGVPLEDVWVHWVELPPGRVFAGGAVR